MPTFIVTYQPAKDKQNADGVAQAIATAVTKSGPWMRLSLATWAVQCDALPAHIMEILGGIVPPSDLFSVAQADWLQLSQPELPWNPPAE